MEGKKGEDEMDEDVVDVKKYDWVDEFYWLDSHNGVNARGKSSSIWVREQECEGFAQELLEKKPQTAGAGLQVTNLQIAFGFTEEQDPRLITRTNTRAVYDAAFKMIMEDVSAKRILVEGAPGTGKSRNLVYLLKLLLGTNRKVIYHHAAERAVYIFVPPIDLLGTPSTANAPSNRYRCYVTSEDLFQSTPEQNLTRNPNNVYLYNAIHIGEPPQVQCFVVIAARPNAKQFSTFLKGGHAKLFKINAFLLEEVVAFFAILHSPDVARSRLAPTESNEADTFSTKLGKVLCTEDRFPLCPEHLEYGFYEIGGSIRGLQSWSTLLTALAVRDAAIAKVSDFKAFNLANLTQFNVTGVPGTVGFYTSKLCSYRNDADPRNYPVYHHRVKVVINSPGTLVAICNAHYSTMYAHMESLLAQGLNQEAQYYFQLLGRTALTRCTVMVARDLNVIGKVTAKVKKHQYLWRLDLPLGRLAAVADLLVAAAALPAPSTEEIALTPWTGVKMKTTVKRAHEARTHVPLLPPPSMPVQRTLLHTEGSFPNVDAFDQRNRGYQFTLNSTPHIQYTPMVSMLNALGCTPAKPFHLFLAVPQDSFDKWLSAQEVQKSDLPALTDAEKAFIVTHVCQYVIRIPKSIT